MRSQIEDIPERDSATQIIGWVRNHLFPGFRDLERRVVEAEGRLAELERRVLTGDSPNKDDADKGETIATTGGPDDYPRLIHKGGGWYCIQFAFGNEGRSLSKQLSRETALDWFRTETEARAA